MPSHERVPFPRHEYLPRPSTLPPPQRLVRLIDTHRNLQKKYRTSYQGVLKALDAIKSETDPGIAHLTPEQRTQIKKALLQARDEVARSFTQTIQLYENTINELAPGTFPRGDEPFGSFDIGEAIESAFSWLADLMRDVGDVFDDFGLGLVADALNAGADGVEWAGKQANDVLHPDEPTPPPEP